MRRLILATLVAMAAAPATAQIMDVLTAPKTLIDRAIEARSAADIAKDNEIVVKVNAAMAELGTVKASTEIYEQRLLVTGTFDDEAVYRSFEQKLRAIKGVRALYWHAALVSKDDPRRKQMLDWANVTAMAAKAQGRLIGTKGVADVNFRVTADSFSTVYLLGRARSGEEAKKALARIRDGNGVRKVVNYVDVRP